MAAIDPTTYETLRIDAPDDDGVLLITINRADRANAVNRALHQELCRLWPEVDADRRVRVAVITGAGRTFCAGGDLDFLEAQAGDIDEVLEARYGAWELIRGMVECRPPIVSAINGAAVGAGLAVALLADVSVAAVDAKLGDGHTRVGVAAGDHAAIIWPLLCGMAKAKHLLLTSDFVDGATADQLGLVSISAERERVLPVAMEIAARLARTSRPAVELTKHALNHWLRQAYPIFEASLNAEMLCMLGDDHVSAVQQLRARTSTST